MSITNHTTLRQTISVPASQMPLVVKNSMLADIDALANDVGSFFEELKPIADHTFVMMKNKKVWFDRNNVAIYPKFEEMLPLVGGSVSNVINYKTDFEGFHFVTMTFEECSKSFTVGKGNPYLSDETKTFRYFKSYSTQILTNRDSGTHYYSCHSDGHSESWSSSTLHLVPICRFIGTNAVGTSFSGAVKIWLSNNLIPENMDDVLEKKYIELMASYCYITFDDNVISMDKQKFEADVLDGIFTGTVFGYDFNLAAKTERVLHKEEKLIVSPKVLKTDLLNCDKLRADLQPYDEKRLTDINLGHWELFEPAKEEDIEIDLPAGEQFVARPPQMDVVESGTCAIDFGTKSTVVVCRNQDARLLRVGKGNYEKAPTAEDYENPTVIELRDIENFMAAYKARDGRPFTQWEQMTVSHQAADAIFQNEEDSSVYYCVFGELKQWANAKGKRYRLRDRQGKDIELKPYEELGEGDFDPIEFYAYYLGLYINNMHNYIYLDYLLSFPVTYESAVREHIRQSFERGLRKSLPPALLADAEIMEMFRVKAGASEPAAYAISALEEYGLQPKEPGQSVAYGVFDFGGGTTDFDFGIEEIPEDGRQKFVIRRFGAGGDSHLGGENILDLLAYEVYLDNMDEMRENNIPFVLPYGCKAPAGTETLIFPPEKASQQAYMNSKRLAKEMRCIWERHEGYNKKFDQPLNLTLFSAKEKDGSDKKETKLRVIVAKLEGVINQRIRQGVDNFFMALLHAFTGRPAYPIHIFLAGNSCKSKLVRPIFDEFIKKHVDSFAVDILESKGQEKDTSGAFVLYPPLGVKWPETETTSAEGELDKKGLVTKHEVVEQLTQQIQAITEQKQAETGTIVDTTGTPSPKKVIPVAPSVSSDFDRKRTGKTGVAFGLLRTRIGGRDVKIIDEDSVDNEIPFPFFLGNIDRDNHFHVRIGMQHPYGQWVRFTFADEPEFELYYTKEASSLSNQFTVDDVPPPARCRFDANLCQDDGDVGVYLRKVKPDTIEYAVGREADFSSGDFQGTTYTKRLKG